MGANKMSLEKSGALAVYAVGRVAPVWTSKTSGNPGAFLAFQMDGNMVLYSAAREPLWAAATNNK
jgi:pseudomonalisin